MLGWANYGQHGKAVEILDDSVHCINSFSAYWHLLRNFLLLLMYFGHISFRLLWNLLQEVLSFLFFYITESKFHKCDIVFANTNRFITYDLVQMTGLALRSPGRPMPTFNSHLYLHEMVIWEISDNYNQRNYNVIVLIHSAVVDFSILNNKEWYKIA